jgi:2-succinyl-5-enolpyruvyl-6-hydroxy-3-cyclohexene-1-carboxylate synthase
MDGVDWPESLAGADHGPFEGHPGSRGTGPAEWADDPGPGRGAAAAEVAGEPRTLVVVGDLPDPAQFDRVLTWARSHGWPVVAEPFGTHPRVDATAHAPLVLSSEEWLAAHLPERVMTVGRLTLSRPVAALLRRPGVRLEVVRTHRWIESGSTVARVWEPDVLDVFGDQGAPPPAGATTWARAWVDAGLAVGAALSSEPPAPASEADPGAGPTAGPTSGGLRSTDVAEVLWREIPSGATLFLGSSNSVRDLDLTSGGRDGELTVVANRGLAGIDGCVSTASGIALAGSGPTYAWMGDLTFLHDSNGLVVGPLERRPDLTLVVTNDDGGGIFTLLEPGEPERAGDFERLFGTPTGTDLAALCAAHGVLHQRVTTTADLALAVARPPRGLRVVEVPVDRSGHRPRHAWMRGAARSVLG